MADPKATFNDMVAALGASKAPLSVRMDDAYQPTADEILTARRTIGHVMADAGVRSRIASLKVEPLVRASSILLEDLKRGKAAKAQREVAESVCEYLDALNGAFGAVPSVLNNRGLARSIAGDHAGAVADLAAARRLAPGFEAARVNEIAVLRKKGDQAQIEKIAAEIEAADLGNAEALRALVDAKLALNRDPKEILGIALRLCAARGARPHDRLTTAMVAAAAGDETATERFLREYIAAEPKDPEGHVRLATSLLNQGKFEGALAEYEALTELDGPKHEYLLAIALIYDHMGRIADAANAFDFALDHASARDQEVIEQAFAEFKERRALAKDGGGPPEPKVAEPEPPAAPPAPPEPAPLATLPGPFDKEEEDIEPLTAQPAPVPDLDSDDFEPRSVGEADIFGVPSKEEPVFQAPAPEAPGEPEAAPAPAPAAPPAAPPAPELQAPPAPKVEAAASAQEPTEESLAEAVEAGSPEAELADDIMGEPPAAAPSLADLDPRPVRAPRPVEVQEPESAPRESEAIVLAQPEPIMVREPEPLPPSVEPTVSAPAPAALDPRPPPLARPAGPLVSAPPPAPPADAPDEDLTAELEALANSSAPVAEEAPAEPEPFRRPTFDVDMFMADLEAKTKPVFDHLYDGMLEQRRNEGPATAPKASLYESAPPTELPSVQAPPEPARPPPERASAGPPAPPTPVEAAPPVMPALFKGAAVEAIRESAPEAPRADLAALHRAQELAKAGELEGAEQAVDAFLRGSPDGAAGWNLKGDLREKAGDDEGALPCYRQAVKYDTRLKEAWNNLGVLLHVMGRLDESAETFEAAVKANPDDRHLWHNLGSTYHELGRLQEALSAFNHAIEVDPNDKVSYNNRGTTLFELGDFAGARESFAKAASLDPSFEQAHNNLGRALEKLEDPQGAVRSYELALALNGKSRAALRNLARVLRNLGREKDAADAESRLASLGA